MAEAFMDPVIRARKIEAIVLKRMHAVASQDALALALNVNASTVSRLISEHLPKLALLMAHVGVKAVPVEVSAYDPEYVRALRVLAARHMQHAAENHDDD
jgi:hypothetical protein